MRKTIQTSSEKAQFDGFLSKDSLNADYRHRRGIEMKRRFSVLNYRRLRLERELEWINSILISLDRQLNNNEKHQKF